MSVTRARLRSATVKLALLASCAGAAQQYSDRRPAATLRMEATDYGVVLFYGGGPDDSDVLGARDPWVFESGGTYYLVYDAAGPHGWLASLAVSTDLVIWEKKGPILRLGVPGEDDSGSASYGVTFHDGQRWHMFYLGTPNTSGPPEHVPTFPYLTMKASAQSPEGPWVKQKYAVPFRTKPNSYYSHSASPGQIIDTGSELVMFFSASSVDAKTQAVRRTLGIARTKDIDGSWIVDAHPILPADQQIENASLYYESANDTWFLFTNHIGIDGSEYTDAVWVYWSRNLQDWNPEDRAVVLDGKNCTWARKCIGLPSVVPVGDRLALFYDSPGGDETGHTRRSIGLAWLDLPLVPPRNRR